ncbi:MAG TPA: ATP-binding protein [Vicinamibacterales bacterium]|nr:ATP-binding protein [Vicinamibacterales bacterium]
MTVRRPRRLGANLSLTAKGLLIVAAPVVAQLIVLMALQSVQSAIAEAEQWAAHSKDVILQADEIHRIALQAIASQRAAVISGDADFHEPADVAPGEVVRLIDDLGRGVNDNPTQTARIAIIRDNAIELERWLAEQRDLVRQGRQAAAIERITNRDGAMRIEILRRNLSAFLADEARIADGRAARLRQVTAQSRWLTVVAALTSLAIACILAFFFSRGISSRFAVVTRNAERLAANEPLAEPIGGSDEIAVLDRALHDSSRKLAEAAAATASARAQLEEKLQQLAALNTELRQQTEENETFIYSVSHDLRSPLVNLQGFSKELAMACAEIETLLDDDSLPSAYRARMTELVDGEIGESVHYIRTAVSRASGIIDSLLRLARIGRVELRNQRVPVAQIVRDVIDAMRATIAAKGAQVVAHPLADAWGDATAIEQVFANLIGNAVNYLDPARQGSIEVGMVPANGKDSSAAPVRTYYVRDNGLGIPKAASTRIFSAFQRHHGHLAAGEGVGLALVRRIVDRHGGRIWFESVEGQGSTFYVELPAEPPPETNGMRHAPAVGDAEGSAAPAHRG